MTLLDDVVSSCNFSSSPDEEGVSIGVSGIDVVGYGVVVPEREMPRISSIAELASSARRFAAIKRARWARWLRKCQRKLSVEGHNSILTEVQ